MEKNNRIIASNLPSEDTTKVKAMDNAEQIQKFKAALDSTNPSENLYLLAVSLRDEGTTQIELYALFAHFQEATSGDDPRYDAIVDTMDLIYGGGWAKGRALYDTQLQDEQIQNYRRNGGGPP